MPIEYYSGIQKGYFWLLSVEKNGFKPAFKAINRGVAPEVGDMSPLKFGTANNAGILYLQPKGEIKVRLVNEEGVPIAGKVRYFDPNTGQSGQMINVPITGAFVKLPSGNNRKLEILPINTDLYQADTMTVQVPQNEVVQKDLKVMYKLHRIHFRIVSGQILQGVENVKITLTGLSSNSVTMYPNVVSPYLNWGQSSPAQHEVINPNSTPTTPPFSQNAPFTIASIYDRTTNSSGRADFAFRNAGGQFTFRIQGPAGSDFIVVDKIVSSTPSKNWQVVTVHLKRGRTVKGKVTIGTDESPIAGARVRVKGSSPLLEVFSNASGEYEMRGVPMDTVLTFSVSKGGAGLVGLEYTEGGNSVKNYGKISYQFQSLQPEGATTTIDFSMRLYNDLDLNKLLGFPLEVTNLTETAGRVYINGILSIPDSTNHVFGMSGTNASGQHLRTIDITNTQLLADALRNADNIPYCKPAQLPVITDINEQPIKLYQSYSSLLLGDHPSGAIVLTTVGQQQQGAVVGHVAVLANSFNSNIFRYATNEQMFIRPPDANTLRVAVFTGSTQAGIPPNGFAVVNGQGEDFRYALHYNTESFLAVARRQSSRIYRDSLLLDTRLQTQLQNITPQNLNLAIGNVRINAERQLEGFHNTIDRNLPMGQFNMKLASIKGDNSGVYIGGVLNALGLELPFQQAQLFPDRIHVPQGSLQVENLSFLGNIPVKVSAPATFGYSGSDQAWYLSITGSDPASTAASISGQHLSHINNDVTILFNSLWFFSDGRKHLLLSQAIPELTLYNAARFYVQSVELGEDVFALNGSLNLGIPGLPSYTTGLLYSRTGSNTPPPLSIRPFAMDPVVVQGVRWHFDHGDSRSLVFSNGSITAKGVLESEDNRVFKGIRYTLTKQNQDPNVLADNIRIGLVADPGQSVLLGGSDNGRMLVSSLVGQMAVSNGAWSLFTFDGDMPEEMGFSGTAKRMFFAAENHLSVRNSTVQLKNIETPFGDLTMSYDIQRHRLLGQLNYHGDMSAMEVNADIEFAIDQYGYYFLSAARMTMPNPSVNAQGFLLFGNYEHRSSDRKSAIESMIREYSYYSRNMDGELPKGYVMLQRLDGFFMEVGAEIPFPIIPNFDIDLVVVSARLKVTIGGDVRLGVNFGDSDSYSMGMSVFVNAEFGLGASALVACGGVELMARAGVNMDGMYWTNGNYDLEVSGFISLTGKAYVGYGLLCTSACEAACFKEEATGTIRLEAIGRVQHNDSSFELRISSNSF